jgi:hypothetical protein
MAAQADYPLCSATVQDQCRNTRAGSDTPRKAISTQTTKKRRKR